MSRMLLVPVLILCSTTLSLVAADESLIQATQAGDTQTVKALLEKGARVNPKNKLGGNALMWAAAAGNSQIVQALVGKGARVKDTDNPGMTVLMWASGHDEVIGILKKAGAE